MDTHSNGARQQVATAAERNRAAFDDDSATHNQMLVGADRVVWDRAELNQLGFTPTQIFRDAYIVGVVEPEQAKATMWVAGLSPVFLEYIRDRQHQLHNPLNEAKLLKTLHHLKHFMYVHGRPDRKRQKLLRTVDLIQHLLNSLKVNVSGRNKLVESEAHGLTVQICDAIADVINTFIIGDSRKNECVSSFARPVVLQGK
jgi:hypothetical protein